MLINEDFNIKTGRMKSKDGKYFPVAYIDPATSESTYQYKDTVKKTYGATWLRNVGTSGTWGWFLSDSEEGNQKIYNNKIKPCLQYLMSVEKTESGEKRDVIAAIDELRTQIMSGQYEEIEGSVANNALKMSKEEIDKRLVQLKEELVGAMSSEDFKAKIEPILKRRRAAGYSFSLNNWLLIWCQDPKATDVRSTTDWAHINRQVKPNAQAIGLFVRYGNKRFKGKEERQRAKEEFLARMNKKSEEDLTPGEKERLRHYLDSTDQFSGGFKFLYNFFDQRFTEQMEGKEDLYGEKKNLQWNNNEGEEHEAMEEYISAAIEVAQDYGVNIIYKTPEELNGALGYANNKGEIALQQDYKKNLSNLSTIVHEMSHTLLHLKYAKSKNKDLEQFFIGTSQGRELVEQQAEISAYIILKQLGFDEEQEYQLNYVAGWGGDASNAEEVFDTVCAASNEITKRIIDKINSKQEV